MPTPATPAAKIDVAFNYRADEILTRLQAGGMLLVTKGKAGGNSGATSGATSEATSGGANAMTIGWGGVTTIWGLPIFPVLVRPSRFTYQLLEECRDFTVNLLPPTLGDVLDLCGKKSGRDLDKIARAGLTLLPGTATGVPIIAQSLIAYECRTVCTADVKPELLDPAVVKNSYPQGNFHRIYFGQVLATRADPAFAG